MAQYFPAFRCGNKQYECFNFAKARSHLGWRCLDSWNCSGQGDSDIAGLGVRPARRLGTRVTADSYDKVLLAFMITAYINLSIAWTGFLLQERKGPAGSMIDIHVLDEHFLHWLWSPLAKPFTLPDRWKKVFERMTLILSDQFLVTGIAVLATGCKNP